MVPRKLSVRYGSRESPLARRYDCARDCERASDGTRTWKMDRTVSAPTLSTYTLQYLLLQDYSTTYDAGLTRRLDARFHTAHAA